MFLELFDAEPVWATIEPLGDTAHGAGVDVDGGGAFALARERAKMLAI